VDEININLEEKLPKLRVTEDRTPEQLVADGDHRWPPGFYPEDGHDARRVYLPPQLKGAMRRQFLRRLLRLEPEPAADAAIRRDAWVRAGGDVVCPQCGEEYRHHPHDWDGFESLTVLCDRSRVKL
jgi:hypothetical protein